MLNKKLLIFAGVIVTLLLGTFLYYKYKSYPDYLVVVPNSSVSTKLRAKKYFDLMRAALPFTAFAPASAISATLIDYTDLSAVDSSGVVSGVSGTDYKLSIYNIGPESFNIIGCALNVTVPSTPPSSKVGMTIGIRGGQTPKQYNGDKVSLASETEIAFINTTGYVMNRIILICDNYKARSLYIYLTNGANQCGGYKFENLTNTILVINLFNLAVK